MTMVYHRGKITDVTDAEIRFGADRPFLHFKTPDASYSIRLEKIEGSWDFAGKLYKRLHIDDREKPSAVLDPLAKSNAPLLRHVLTLVDITKLDQQLADVLKKREDDHSARMHDMMLRQAKAIRATFKKLAKAEKVNHVKIAYEVLANSNDDEGLVDLMRKLYRASESAE
jgi:hypothetical protein